MVNEIITAISQRLCEAFDDPEIYIDKLPQGFDEPCFFIRALQAGQKQIIGDRYFRTHGFDMHYFPAERCNVAREINEVADRLWMALEYIDLPNGPMRGTQMRREVEDDVLHFFVNYDTFIFKVHDRGAKMRTLQQKQKIKGE